MKYILLLISVTASLIYARPQSGPNQKNAEFPSPSTEDLPKNYPLSTFSNDGIVKQRQIEASTREILDKIEELNKKQGLLPKKPKPSYFHFPFSYSRASSQEMNSISSTKNILNKNDLTNNSPVPEINIAQSNIKAREGNGFKFPKNPFVNPIFEYLDSKSKENVDKVLNNEANKSFNPATGFKVSVVDTNPEILKEDIIPGQYIKRKITHHQTFFVPNINSVPNNMGGYYQMPQYNPPAPSNTPHQYPYYNYNPYAQRYNNDNQTHQFQFQNMERQTIDAVKNIVTTSQVYNPFAQYVPQQQYQEYYPQQLHPAQYQQFQPVRNYEPYQVYGPFLMPNSPTAQEGTLMEDNYKARQWDGSWPGAQYFPIVIKDPLMQMYNAITSMVEYGMAGGGGGGAGCKKPNKPPKKMEKDNSANSTSSLPNGKNSTTDRNPKIIEEAALENRVELPENLDTAMPMNFTNLNLNISNKSSPMQNDSSTFQPPNPFNATAMEIKKFKSHWVLNNGTSSKNSTANRQIIGNKLSNLASLSHVSKNNHKIELRQSPPIRDQPPYEDELEEESVDKAEDISIENDHNKKVFTRENTGSGIFIHKLKVRKGGVAIAGPGGIATAGSGGTAIVGPNGVAYTHPDGLAIAGSGTRVVAVDPNISLSDIINNSTVGGGRNRTKLHHARVGKVVAVGPVVYYNKG